jgi:hypothetical protein
MPHRCGENIVSVFGSFAQFYQIFAVNVTLSNLKDLMKEQALWFGPD